MSKLDKQDIAMHENWIRWHQKGIGGCMIEIEGYQGMIEYHRERIKLRQDLIDGKEERLQV
jgi:hypothetical protein